VFATLLVGDGYLWLLDNRSPNLILSATFSFDLQNLSLLNHNTKRDVSVDLQPGQRQVLRFVMQDTRQAWGYKYGYNYRVTEIVRSEAELERAVRNKGEVKGFNYQGKENMARYYVHFLNETYYFLFENLSTNEVFKGTFNFTLDNLRLEDATAAEPSSFKLELGPGEKLMKKLTRVDNSQKSKYKLSFSYCFTSVD
jgi:hypothetical protein